MIGLRAYAEKHDSYEEELLVPEALRLLQASQNQVQKLMERNVFLAESEGLEQLARLAKNPQAHFHL